MSETNATEISIFLDFVHMTEASNSSHATPTVYVEAMTWQRDSHELFDYESQSVQRVSSVVAESSRFFRQGTQLIPSNEGDLMSTLNTFSSEEVPTDYLMSWHVIHSKNNA